MKEPCPKCGEDTTSVSTLDSAPPIYSYLCKKCGSTWMNWDDFGDIPKIVVKRTKEQLKERLKIKRPWEGEDA